jgi:hypothetical protein
MSFNDFVYNSLSGSAEFEASVDWFVGFFLWNMIWAELWLAVTSNSAPMRRSANRRNPHLTFLTF